jgi:DNA-binding MarR family transcriptional regulator
MTNAQLDKKIQALYQKEALTAKQIAGRLSLDPRDVERRFTAIGLVFKH